jgi:two-component sensor histidine kinase
MVKVQQYAMEETQAAETTHDSTVLAYVYARRLNAELDDMHDRGAGALAWGYKSLAEFRRWNEDLLSYRVAHNIGIILINMGKNKDALYFLDSLLKRRSPEDPGDKHEVYLMLGMVYIDLDSLDKAQHYLLLAQQLQRQVSQFSGDLKVSLLYFLLGKLYFAKQQFEKSRGYFSIALLHPNNFEDVSDWASIYKYFASIDSASGRYREAYLQSVFYNRIMDSVRQKVNVRLIDEMRTKYETDKKDNNIKILQQQAALQASRSRQNLFARNVLIGGAASLLIVLLLLYNRFRLKQRTNLQLQAQKNEITYKNAELQQLVGEKEWLLKEVHHRVKNNLHSIICLLESQAQHLQNDALKAIEISQHRIYAMSLIHQKLYQSSDLKAVDMAAYLSEFTRYLYNSFDNTGQIDFSLNVQPVRLDVAQAVPLALIVNEAVTNSIKYAFPGGRKGTVRISMRHSGGIITLRIADDGIGIAAEIIDSPVNSLGLKLIRGLSEDLRANVKIKNDGGTVIELQFQGGLLDTAPMPASSFEYTTSDWA